MPAQIENVPSKRMLKPLILSIQQTKSKQMRPIFTQFLQAALGTYITFYTLHFIFECLCASHPHPIKPIFDRKLAYANAAQVSRDRKL